MRYRDKNGDDWADIIDFLTMYPGGAAAEMYGRARAALDAGSSGAAVIYVEPATTSRLTPSPLVSSHG
jgi:hypothetical protein